MQDKLLEAIRLAIKGYTKKQIKKLLNSKP